jgi:hypothetical protein
MYGAPAAAIDLTRRSFRRSRIIPSGVALRLVPSSICQIFKRRNCQIFGRR